MAHDGIFTPPNDGGIFRDGSTGNMDAPPIDGDDTPLRETLVVAYPAPGHMHVARAIRHPKSGNVEFQEQYRVPTDAEKVWLKQQGIDVVGPGSMIPPQSTGGMGAIDTSNPNAPIVTGSPASSGPPAPASTGTPWVKIGIALAAGAAGMWVVGKWVVPKLEDWGVLGGGDDDSLDSHEEKAYD